MIKANVSASPTLGLTNDIHPATSMCWFGLWPAFPGLLCQRVFARCTKSEWHPPVWRLHMEVTKLDLHTRQREKHVPLIPHPSPPALICLKKSFWFRISQEERRHKDSLSISLRTKSWSEGYSLPQQGAAEQMLSFSVTNTPVQDLYWCQVRAHRTGKETLWIGPTREQPVCTAPSSGSSVLRKTEQATPLCQASPLTSSTDSARGAPSETDVCPSLPGS